MSTHRPWIVAVDGPAGSGKSSICQIVCRHIGFSYVNTGAIYRAVAFIAEQEQLDLQTSDKLEQVMAELEEKITWNSSSGHIFYCGEDITLDLSSERYGIAASKIATSAKIRTSLLPLQRKLAKESQKGSLLDGRDIGSVVFPNADLKIYMTASIEQRARRRLSQLQENAPNGKALPSMDELVEDMKKRDYQDSHRTCAPLVKSSDAIEIDTSELSLEETVATLQSLIEGKFGMKQKSTES